MEPGEPPARNGGGMNRWNGKAYSSDYYEILKERKRLPVWPMKKKFLQLFNGNQTVVVVGNTGSGKTTQIPQFVVEAVAAESDSGFLVGCTQPRRIAAISVSRRVSEEMDLELGQEVGYTIRFEDCTSPRTVLKYLTDGMLLREAMSDPHLGAYNAIILDEAHERTLPTEVLFGLLKRALKARTELKLIIMSATIEAEKFQKFFNGAPLMEIPGRLHPVELLYLPKPESDYVATAVQTAVDTHRFDPCGDILIFLTGEQEIEDACRRIRQKVATLGHQVGPVKVVPLYSALAPALQEKAFETAPEPVRKGGPKGRKIVVSTNIAETSLTIDGIVYVIDSGLAKQKVYDPTNCVESLSVSLISKASAQQRLGRAGRTRPGKCYRLYTQDTFDNVMDPQTCPAILRSNLSGTVLTLLSMGISNLVQFEFMDRPSSEILMRALEVLNYLGAVDDAANVTAMGELLCQFPLDPQMAKMVIASPHFNCTKEILSLAAMLSVPNVFEMPTVANTKFGNRSALSDHFTLLTAYEEYTKNREKSEWSERCIFNHMAMLSVECVREQLVTIMSRCKLECSASSHSLTNIKKAILSGYFLQVANLQSSDGYSTINDGNDCFIHPSSCLVNKPDWVVYHENLLTSRNFIRTVTAIKREWLVEVCPHFHQCETKKKFSQISKKLLKKMKEHADARGEELPVPYIPQADTHE